MQVAVALWKLRAPSTPIPHTKSHHPLFSLPTNKSRKYTNQVFFSPVTPSRITTNDILKSPQVRFLIVWSYFNYFTVEHPAVRNFMRFQFSAKHMRWGIFCENSQLVEAVGCFCGGAVSWMLDRILYASLPNNLFLLSHPWFTPT